ncbi:MAG: hypothetical protein P4L96_01585 [Rhodoferax sp.]|nr:hypothetical protein [Rhodoferax sp.]
MIETSKSFRTLSAILLIGGAAACGLSAHAQAPSGANDGTGTSSGGGVIQKVEKTTKKAVNATERSARKVGHAVGKAASRAAGSVRRTGDKIGEKLPKGNHTPPSDARGPAGDKTL